MKRDMDLVRTLLLKIEAEPAMPCPRYISFDDPWFEVEGHDPAEVVEHLRQLHGEGFLEGTGVSMGDFALFGLTWRGAEFVDSIRQEAVWRKAKDVAERAGGGGANLLFQIARDILTKAALGAVGL